MTSINSSSPITPAMPAFSPLPATPAAAAPETAPDASGAAPEEALAPAQLGTLDAMMQGFLADGQLDANEQQAYEAARAAFTQEMPLPPDDSPADAALVASPLGGAAPAALPPATPAQAASNPYLAAAQAYEAAARAYESVARALLAAGQPAAGGGGALSPAWQVGGQASVAAPAQPAPQAASAGLQGAIEDYRRDIYDHDQQAEGYMAGVFSGLTGVGTRAIHLLPGMMIPDGVRLLSWAALDREPTDAELNDYKQIMAGPDTGAAMQTVANKIMGQAADPAAAAAKLVWSPSDFWGYDTPQSRQQQAAFNQVMQQEFQGPAASPAPAPQPVAAPAAPAPAPAPAGPPPAPVPIPVADYAALQQRIQPLMSSGDKTVAGAAYAIHQDLTNRGYYAKQAANPDPSPFKDGDGQPLKGVAVVGPVAFTWAGRPNPGLLGGWDSPPLGKTYVTADPLMSYGGYNDIHYWPDCPDPAYKAMWELIFAANDGDKAAWTELEQINQVYGGDLLHFIESRPMQVNDPKFATKDGPFAAARQQDIANLMVQAHDRWKGGKTTVVTSDDPNYAAMAKNQYATLMGEVDQSIATANQFLPPK